MGLINRKKAINNDLSLLLDKVYEKGLVEGYDSGYDDGYEDGYIVRKNEDKAAISDGLRKGSSECGKTMRKM